MTRTRSNALWTFAITSLALFMVALDNLVVTTALPVIKADLGASLADLQWMVNAYTLTFAVLLLTGAALGDRFGRKRVFVIGMGDLHRWLGRSRRSSPSTDVLILARAIQGVGGAIVTPLTLTILSAAMPPERRAVALGAWGGIAGLAIAIGPLVGGAIAEGLDWHWIFWLNVPIGLVVLPLAAFRLTETLRSGRPARRAGSRPRQRRSAGARVGRHQRQRPRLGQPAGRRRARRRCRPPRRLRGLGGAHGAPDAADVVLPQPRASAPPTPSRC